RFAQNDTDAVCHSEEVRRRISSVTNEIETKVEVG
ncbi:MAG: hypothetical protein PWQ17_2236, partial [Anaerophaga sp.]|nr:hypothetical protein [Anaerophaga sp.]